MTKSWTQPTDDDGYLIAGYAVFIDEGDGSDIDEEVNSPLDTNIRDHPTLFQTTITSYPATPTGLTFRYQVHAFNKVGYVVSESVSFILGKEPQDPTTGPVEVDSSSSSIRVTLPGLTTTAEIGGTTLLSYNLQMDDGLGSNNFVDLYGVTSDTLVTDYTTTNVVKGRTYAFRYRTRNIFGWSTGWSPVTYILAADKPSQPAKPILTAASDVSISL
jgi:hypothetical protein